jgi:hypothetical protein
MGTATATSHQDGIRRKQPRPAVAIVHVRVVNEPLLGFVGKVLLRNPAAGCTVDMQFVSRSDRSSIRSRGKWSAKPEPLGTIPEAPGIFRRIFDPEKIPQTLTLDLLPSEEGETVAIAIKHNGDAQAYAFDPAIYAPGNLRNHDLALPHETYDVTVTATAGGIKSEPCHFVLHNAGTEYRGLRLESHS